MKPRLSRILWTDWPALFFLLAIPLIWVAGFLFPLKRPSASFGSFEMFTIAAPISLVAGRFLVWRILRIRALFQRGHLTKGRITGIRIARDRGRLEFSYDFAGRPFQSWMPVHKNKQVLAFQIDQEVDVLVDPRRPHTAIVRDLYA